MVSYTVSIRYQCFLYISIQNRSNETQNLTSKKHCDDFDIFYNTISDCNVCSTVSSAIGAEDQVRSCCCVPVARVEGRRVSGIVDEDKMVHGVGLANLLFLHLAFRCCHNKDTVMLVLLVFYIPFPRLSMLS